MKKKTEEKALFNSINLYSWLNLFSKLIIPICILPLIFKKYNADDSQEWLYFLNIMSMAVFFDFGSISLQNRIYGYIKGKAGISAKVFNTKFNSILLFTSVFWLFIVFLYLNNVRGSVSLIVVLGLISNYIVVYVQNIIFAQSYIVKSKNIETFCNVLRLIYTIVLIQMNSSFDILLNYYYGFYIFLALTYLYLLRKVCVHYLYGLSNPINLIKKYKKQIFGAWIATSFSTGVFFISNVYLVDKFSAFAWGNYLLTVRIVDMIANMAFVPFYSRIPNFINMYFKNEKVKLKNEIFRNLLISIGIYVALSVFCLVFVNIVLDILKTNTKLTGIKNALLIFISMLLYKLGTSFLQISAFGNKVDWHKPVITQFIMVVAIFLGVQSIGIEYKFSIPFSISVLFFLPYTIYLARKNF
ncbi:hypothetical protein [Flavobacterium sp. HJJ]|uniref:hypothetical protein n=1 Tax=Flavobacterium sp. HJJ TaxID=2783792 RepID=UPI00188A0017|nr:hypothetical protein [Flavobacterium sp. HJJ]MBF4470428.1 hypothetical protein [Flavobacterium sp. HJJ]